MAKQLLECFHILIWGAADQETAGSLLAEPLEPLADRLVNLLAPLLVAHIGLREPFVRIGQLFAVGGLAL